MKIECKEKKGLTFDGLLKEFPKIKVDNFTIHESSVPELFLLSHCHEDHLVGLLGKKTPFTQKAPIVTTDATKRLLKNSISPDALQAFLVCPIDNKIKFTLSEEIVYITLIPAYHCIGSVMFLIESEDLKRSCLYTGDLRADELFVSSLKYNIHLLPYIKDLQIKRQINLSLGTIYLDTTFAYRMENIMMLPNIQGLYQIVETMRLYPKSTKFLFPEMTTGFEEMWVYLSKVFGIGSVILCPEARSRVEALCCELNGTSISESSLLTPYLPSNSLFELLKGHALNDDGHHNFELYFGRPKDYEENVARKVYKYIVVQPVINVTSREFERLGVVKVAEEQLFQKFGLIEDARFIENDIYKRYEDDKKYILDAEKGFMLPLNLKYYFSRHSSCSETLDFVGQFRTKEVYAIVESESTWHRGFTMERYYGHLCESDTFRFDEERALLYGPALNTNASVELINNLGLSECLKRPENTNKSQDDSSNSLVFKGQVPRQPKASHEDKHYIRRKLFITQNSNGFSTYIRDKRGNKETTSSISSKGDGSQEEKMLAVLMRKQKERRALPKQNTACKKNWSVLRSIIGNLADSDKMLKEVFGKDSPIEISTSTWSLSTSNISIKKRVLQPKIRKREMAPEISSPIFQSIL